jgi:hypothetical protein
MRRGLLGAILGFSSLLLIFVACVRQVPTLEYATLTIQSSESAIILKGQVHYDPTALTLVGANSLIATAIAEASASEGVVDFGFVLQTAVQEEVLELVFTSTRKGAAASLVGLSVIREDESESQLSLEGASWERGLKQNPYLTAESAELAALALTAKPVLKAEVANTPLGDFNGSSRVNLLDALQLTVDLLTKTPLSDYQLYHADISGNGTINSEDIKGIIQDTTSDCYGTDTDTFTYEATTPLSLFPGKLLTVHSAQMDHSQDQKSTKTGAKCVAMMGAVRDQVKLFIGGKSCQNSFCENIQSVTATCHSHPRLCLPSKGRCRASGGGVAFAV